VKNETTKSNEVINYKPQTTTRQVIKQLGIDLNGTLGYGATVLNYGTANPSTWNPAQRAGPDGKPIDQKWTMSLFARDADTGMAKWIYQMTPFDEWDYDGVNENILADLEINGEERKVLVNFDRNGFAYTMDRASGELLVAKKYDPTVNWATEVNMDPSSDQYGRPQVVAEAECVRSALGDLVAAIHHIGSTAIPGIAARKGSVY
jgi:glucose dehydrogenase